MTSQSFSLSESRQVLGRTPAALDALLRPHDWAHLAQITRVLTRHHGQWVGPWRTYFSLLRST